MPFPSNSSLVLSFTLFPPSIPLLCSLSSLHSSSLLPFLPPISCAVFPPTSLDRPPRHCCQRLKGYQRRTQNIASLSFSRLCSPCCPYLCVCVPYGLNIEKVSWLRGLDGERVSLYFCSLFNGVSKQWWVYLMFWQWSEQWSEDARCMRWNC